MGEGSQVQAARACLAGDDGSLLSEQRLALSAPGRFRPFVPVQDEARDTDMGAGVGEPFKCGMRNADCGLKKAACLSIRNPHSEIRNHKI